MTAESSWPLVLGLGPPMFPCSHVSDIHFPTFITFLIVLAELEFSKFIIVTLILDTLALLYGQHVDGVSARCSMGHR